MREDGFLIAVPGAGTDPEMLGAGLERRLSPDLQSRPLLEDTILLTGPALPVLPLPGGRGVLLGTLFRRHGAAGPVAEQDAHDLAVIADRGAGALLDHYWGGYVALLRDAAGKIQLLRDPSGAVPLYRSASGCTSFFAPDPFILVRADALKPAVDWTFVRHALVYPRYRTARTGLDGCREILPGTLAAPDGRSALAWSPWKFTRPDREIRDPGQAAAALRNDVQRCVSALVPLDRRVLLELSGGLDSSIIASCLQGRKSAEAVTFATRTADGDERRHARLAAQRAGIELHELVEPDAAPRLARPDILLPRPGLSPVLAAIDSAIHERARQADAECLVSGGGGDNVFCYLTTAAPAVDAALSLGRQAGLATLSDVAAVAGCTLWTAARFAAGTWWRHRRGSTAPWPERSFLSRSARSVAPEIHPWLAVPPQSLPGKIEHVRAIVSIHDFLDTSVRGRSMPILFPLLAQPIMETCLRIPAWLWFAGGRDRSVARSAFADRLPPQIVQRRTKGRLESSFARTYAALRPEIAELLLGGLLDTAGLLDTKALSTYLAEDCDPSDDAYYRLFGIVGVELWARSIARVSGARAAMASQRRY